MIKSKSAKSIFRCLECGYEAYQWLGKCPECGQWNTFQAASADASSAASPVVLPVVDVKKVKKLHELGAGPAKRFETQIKELDRVLGGGFCQASTVLLAGEPGIGKSTLLLQVAEALSKQNHTVLYVSAEESLEQIQERGKRLGVKGENIALVSELRVEGIQSYIEKLDPSVVIVDSIQSIQSGRFDAPPGSVTQVRESALVLSHFMRDRKGVLVLIGHVTKDGVLAGPKTLEHLVDCVLYFEGDRYQSFRMLRTIKNRYGAAGEMSLFDMQPEGLVEVKNPSEIFLSDHHDLVSGRVAAPILEGNRPLVVEVQALVNKSAFNNPVRRAVGLDPNRVSLLLAVIEKTLGISFFNQDVFLKVVGGLSIEDPGVDLSIALALLSSFYEKPLSHQIAAVGEVGLGGEVRRIRFLDRRVQEADRLGFKQIFIPRNAGLKIKSQIQMTEVKTLKEVFDALFSK
jgi:DNA repair protein RadA/Sms